jgi:hypothetical protein
MHAYGSDGTYLPLRSLDQTLHYNVSDQLDYIEVVCNSRTYRQTLIYTSGKVTSVSRWELQS